LKPASFRYSASRDKIAQLKARWNQPISTRHCLLLLANNYIPYNAPSSLSIHTASRAPGMEKASTYRVAVAGGFGMHSDGTGRSR
jgi:hypothetical protein